jgi:ferrous-iron efflux pump FieF
MTEARRIALRVSAAAFFLAAAKATVGLLTGSVAVLSSALDSAGDMLASLANFLFITVAHRPPDEGHPFGHGKAEHLAALLQGAILITGAAMLAIRAIHRIDQPRPVDASFAAILTMVLSIVATAAITRYLRRGAAANESSALASDAVHYASDVLANLATIAALALVRLTGNPLFDSILGLVVAAWIAWSAVQLVWGAGNDLMDASLPAHEIAQIVEAIERADPAVLGWQELRSRRAGVRFIDVELCIDRAASFEHAHAVTEKVKAAIRERFPHSVVNVHAEPVGRGVAGS